MTGEEGTAGRVAQGVLAGLRSGDFEAATRAFDDTLRPLLPPAALERTWQDLGRQFGDLRGVDPAELESAGEATVVTIRCHFDRGALDLRVTVGAQSAVSGLYLRPAAPAGEAPTRRRRADVLALVVPLLAAASVAVLAGHALRWSVVAGAAGWLLALALRGPAILLASRLGLGRLGPTSVLVSGPVEEVVRLAGLALAGRAVADAVWLGVGWGAAETAFTVVVGWRHAAGQRVVRRPVLGALERASAVAFHVGAALVLSRWWAGVLPVAALHSWVNGAGLRLAARSPMAAQLLLAGVAAGLLAAGVVAVN